MVRFVEVEDADARERICRSILAAIPRWFGLPDSNEEYALGVRDHHFVAVLDGDEMTGFASIRTNTPFTAEIYVMGMVESRHRMGIGTRLIDVISGNLREAGYVFLEVKTLDESRESEEYRRTRLFYRKAGFFPLEVLPGLWGPENPCLIMVKKL